jgi:acetylornithine deacetylase/succinyl-diaminopimelate desuccinylase-like protein
LNSHHDTVKPNKAYTLNPFEPIIKDDKLYGLGSNDAGGCLVSLIAVFLYFYQQENLTYNLILAATAEEEISGHNGVEILLPRMPNIDCGIVGEPTLLQMAVAEKGLLVLDCTAHGKPGHAAREEGDNAIYKAVRRLSEYNQVKQIIITENGSAFDDIVSDDRVNDVLRKEYLIQHLRKLLKAKTEGAKINGYFVWTLMDNFEWAEGYKARFGLVHVDFETQKRIIKDSGKWYRDFLAN